MDKALPTDSTGVGGRCMCMSAYLRVYANACVCADACVCGWRGDAYVRVLMYVSARVC